MKPYIKYANLTIFLVVVTLFVALKPYANLSTELSSLLPQNKETKLLKVYSKFKNSREVLVAVKGEDLEHIKALEKKVLQRDFLALKKYPWEQKSFQEYLQKYQFYLQDFEPTKTKDIKPILQNRYDEILSNLYYTSVNEYDPLELFSKKDTKRLVELRNGYIYLKDYGYMSIFSYDKNVQAKEVYEVFKEHMKDDTKIFSPSFYYVENSRAIKSQVNILILVGVSLLSILYIVILRNISLLFNTVLTLLSASMFSLISITMVWDEVSIFVMVLGVSISTVAVDYMFHNYFCGYYEKERGFNSSVFTGFFSTFIAFFIISFVDFPLIKQVSLYSLISLGFSYIVFSFIFPKISFSYRKINKELPSFVLIKRYKYFTLVQFIILATSLFYVELDLNIKSLDFQNTSLKKTEEFFKERLQVTDKTPFLISATSIDKLISKSSKFHSLHVEAILPLASIVSKEEYKKREESLQQIDFSQLRTKIDEYASEIGFRKGTFEKAYPKELLYPKLPSYDIKILQKYGFDIVFDENRYYSYGFIEKQENLEKVFLVNSLSLFKESLQKIEYELLAYGALILLAVLAIVYRHTRENFFQAVSYILFPLVVIFLVIVTNPINILQIFMLFIILSLSIDYGIYMSKKSVGSQRAILFSLVSTFAGFGILVFSSIGVLFYIGQVALLGLIAIFILLFIGKR